MTNLDIASGYLQCNLGPSVRAILRSDLRYVCCGRYKRTLGVLADKEDGMRILKRSETIHKVITRIVQYLNIIWNIRGNTR